MSLKTDACAQEESRTGKLAQRSAMEAEIEAMPGNGPEYDFASISPMENSPLAGKKIAVLGSSVAYGLCSLQQAVGEYLSARFGTVLTKEAVSGTTLVDKDRDSYVSRLHNIDPKEDFALFLCQLSTNDAIQGMPLGEVSPGREEADFDTSTITGAMEYIILYAKETWNCPVIFFTGSRFDSSLYALMVSRLYDLKEKWGIGILDLWTDDGFNEITDEERKLYMHDPIHPARAGYRCWWGPEQEKQLLTLT